MIPYKFKGSASMLYSADGTRKIIEHEIGGYSTLASKVNIGNGIFWACSARSHINPVKALLFLCAMGIIALGVHLETK